MTTTIRKVLGGSDCCQQSRGRINRKTNTKIALIYVKPKCDIIPIISWV